MASNDVMVWAALFVAAVAAILMWNLSRKPGAAPAEATGAGPTVDAAEGKLLRFVHDAAGERKGETVAVDGERMSLKTPEGFASVPAAQLEEADTGLRLTSEVDWESARREGEAWRERSYKEIKYSPEEPPKDES
jgi:hypothetical protein